MSEDPYSISRARLRRARNRGADRYDNAAVLQREVGERLLERLDWITLAPKRVLDLGCASGYCTRRLAERYPAAEVIGVDDALRLLSHAQAEQGNQEITAKPRYLCALSSRTALASGSVKIVLSNLAQPWTEALIKEARRVLEPGGLLLFSTYGRDTLQQLRAAFAGLDQATHVQRFEDLHDIGDQLVRNGFAEPVLQAEQLTLTYATLAGLTTDLKAWGLRNHTRGRPRALYGKRRWREVARRYEAMRTGGALPASFEIVYAVAWKPQPRTMPDGRPIIDLRQP